LGLKETPKPNLLRTLTNHISSLGLKETPKPNLLRTLTNHISLTKHRAGRLIHA